MIKREYFFSGNLNSEGEIEFSGTHSRISFKGSSIEAMREIEAEISRKTGADKSKIIFKVFRRI